MALAERLLDDMSTFLKNNPELGKQKCTLQNHARQNELELMMVMIMMMEMQRIKFKWCRIFKEL